ncbi:MAG: hypothetical protein HYX92_07955 [Chloroflexi bacterium]|nr:hypothetical protein [Chloroflexota bacterium]
MEGLVQIAPYSFIDEGIDRVIQMTRDYARLSGLVLFTYSWSKITAFRSSRLVEGHPQPPSYDFRGGLYTQAHSEHYRGSPFGAEQLRTRDAAFKDVDILARVLKPCQQAGLKVYAGLHMDGEPDYVQELAPGFRACSEVDAWGEPLGVVASHGWRLSPFLKHCFNNPDYRAVHRALVKDHLQSYPLDGLMLLVHERFGPIENTLIFGGRPTCFCGHCVAKARTRGIDVEAARSGLRQLYEFATRVRSETYHVPNDGHFTTLMRLLLAYPEVLAWEKLWRESVEEYLKELYGAAKEVRPEAPVGLHVWQGASWGLFHRSETYYGQLADCADWLKPVVYEIPSGVRLLSTYARPCQQTILRDLDFEQVVALLVRIMGLEAPADSGALARDGLGVPYIEKETARAVAATAGKTALYPGLGIDVEPPPGMQYPSQSAEDIQAAIAAAKRGGAKGFVLSVNYAQMRESSLRAVGRALRKEQL